MSNELARRKAEMLRHDRDDTPMHTPGPWTAKFGPGAGGGYQGVDGPKGERVALCDEDTRMGVFTREANARLIAAAPKMYAELESISASLSMEFPNWQATVLRIDALLAKARGESTQ